METKNDKARLIFKEKGLSYLNIKKEQIEILQNLLKEELSSFENHGFIMKLCALRKNDVEFNDDGTLKKCYFRAKGIIKGSNNGIYKPIIHFKEREAISFNQDGFIGFAGWADSTNVVPFLKAFNRFTLLS